MLVRKENKIIRKSTRRMTKESANRSDITNIFSKHFNLSPEDIDVYISRDVWTVLTDKGEYWVLTEDEARREATNHFLDTFDGSMIENDSVLNNVASGGWCLDNDRIMDMAENLVEGDPDSNKDPYDMDEEELHDWAYDTFSVQELWDNGMIDKQAFCDALWEDWGYGHELDKDGVTDDEAVNGETYYFILVGGERD